ncbi:MAG: DUF2868 domain-containing protein [Gammaproteobacteria bacterium]|nr:DUF2868 domain-containing protein [Gammaproteobacteria bacterium]
MEQVLGRTRTLQYGRISEKVESGTRTHAIIAAQMLDQLLIVDSLLAGDARKDLAELHRRDRAIGRDLVHLARRPAAQVLAWAERRSGIPEATMHGVRRAERGLGLVLVLIGFLAGCLAAGGVLYYEGSGRVNVLAALALLVGLQLIMLALSLILMLPAGARGFVPGLGSIQDGLSTLSPGRLLGLLAKWLTPAAAERLRGVLANATVSQRRYARVRKWLVLRASQLFAVAFNVGLLAAYLSLVVFTDLAFGWSTTLDVDASRVQRLVELLARPWHGWLAPAVPSAELVEATRYYRADPRAVSDAAFLGRWWTFLFMCLAVYGLLPRLVLLGLASWRLDRAARWTLLHLPGVAELRYRLNREAVETQAEEPEPAGPQAPASSSDDAIVLHGRGVAILWGGLDLGDADTARVLARAAGLETSDICRAGGGDDFDADADTIRTAATADGPIVIVVKAWEPPLGELVDFIAELRGAAGRGRALLVVPIAENPLHAPSASDVAIWRRHLASIGDAWLTVRALTAENER